MIAPRASEARPCASEESARREAPRRTLRIEDESSSAKGLKRLPLPARRILGTEHPSKDALNS
jgi:hypothetical protein